LQRTSVAISLGAATAAHAQQSGLVNVDVSNLRADIAKDLNVNASQIPVNVPGQEQVAGAERSGAAPARRPEVVAGEPTKGR
jgi:hypothetical protein